MKPGDIVTIDVPAGTRQTGNMRTLYSTKGIVIEMKKIPHFPSTGRPECHEWWYVLRSDTGSVEKFHSKWMEVISESR